MPASAASDSEEVASLKADVVLEGEFVSWKAKRNRQHPDEESNVIFKDMKEPTKPVIMLRRKCW